jgi:peptide-methionine (S)-S-oxide reductase
MHSNQNRSFGAKFTALILISLTMSLQSCGQKSDSKKAESPKTNQTMNTENLETITLAGGCYWCIEAIYQRLDGVVKVESGFSGGTMKNPSYRDVCTGETGHAECVQVTFDKTKTSLDEVFKVFFTVHDPTTLNRQGADEGTQYRSAIFYRTEEQKKAAESIIADLTKAGVYSDPIVTQVVPFTVFYKAEDYHQDYYNQHGSQPYCQIVIRPKVEKFEKVFKDRLKK